MENKEFPKVFTCTNTPLFLLFEFFLLLNSPSSRLLLAGQLSKLVSGFNIEVKYKVQHFKTIVTFITFNHCAFSIPATRLRDNTHNSLKNHNTAIANQERVFMWLIILNHIQHVYLS